jgi:hypothetical protein
MRYPRRLFVFRFLLGLLISFPLQPLAADPPAARVLILPLAIHSEKELAFLHHGVVDMLAARIGQSAEVIRHASLDPPQEPVQAGRDRLADYIVSGSLTVFDDRVSTDVMLTAVDTDAVALHFSRLGRSGGDILSHIDAFATQVNQYLASISAGDSGALLQPRAKVPPISPADDAAATPPPAVLSVPVAPPLPPERSMSPFHRQWYRCRGLGPAMPSKAPSAPWPAVMWTATVGWISFSCMITGWW